MTDSTQLGSWVRRFLLEHLMGERNLARNTQRSYRDALVLLLPFIAGHLHKPVEQLRIDDLAAEHVQLFLQDVEQRRQ
ncbi:MAG: site-specific integrase, partial [Planctomycetota bacterium]